MAWSLIWKPQKIATFIVDQKTVISRFESGKEQRRKKWSRPKHRFLLTFDALSYDVVNDIRAWFKTYSGAYSTFDFANTAQAVRGKRLTLALNGASPDTIVDSSSEFVDIGFHTDLKVTVGGSNVGNDGEYTVSGVVAGTLTLPNGSLTADESSYTPLGVYVTYTVRFNEDTFENTFLTIDKGNVRTIELIEVI